MACVEAALAAYLELRTPSARDGLLAALFPHVVIAAHYHCRTRRVPRDCDPDDLAQDAMLALQRRPVVDRYDPAKGVPFMAYVRLCLAGMFKDSVDAHGRGRDRVESLTAYADKRGEDGENF